VDTATSIDGIVSNNDDRPYLGQVIFREIWDGPDNAVRAALNARFGDSHCSRWASGGRRPDGDSRAVIEEITRRGGIPIVSKWWSWRVEVLS
jgi:hypothetical protein